MVGDLIARLTSGTAAERKAAKIELVREWIRDSDPDVRTAAVRFMKSLDVDASTEAAIRKETIEDDPDEGAIGILIDRFSLLGPSALTEVIPLLLSVAKERKALEQISDFLFDVGTPAAIEALLALLRSTDDHCKVAAAAKLKDLGGDHAVRAASVLKKLSETLSDDPLGQKAATLLSTMAG